MDEKNVWIRWTWWIGLAAVIVIVVAVLVYAAHIAVSQAVPPLVERLPSVPTIADGRILSHRLQQEFPVGSPEADLIRELWIEGFNPVNDLKSVKRRARFDGAGRVLLFWDMCRRTVEIDWSADQAGRISEIAGSYFWSCP